ncbi:sugar ABC transporter ATP-binding protein [Lachnotalea glycerini]|uniref:Sugar ABC transporter ATP-binding protein n=1 Tax=Lachnotalea glycerini TaxID=1763509 RepID=A0A371JFX1_9FIRM|nr:sugar ABC transporter ATP-binding protein [Lachnotalea glycerini]RDY31651.1 sugar ABC transporter ATP-binding protein [Lachnotalea glycerini]
MKNNKEILFEAKELCKNFGSTAALKHVNLTVYRGEVRGLIGENGSGKSTISSIAAGMQPATSGEMYFKGQPHKPATMIDGAKAGFGMIVQEMGTIPGITIAQNIFLGQENLFKKHGFISLKDMYKEAKKALDAIGFTDCDPKMYIDALNMQDRKLVEIAKVMYNKPEVLVVDETTTALSQKGRDIIYKLIKQMKEENKAVLFISHDLDETMKQCDTLTVLRDGELVTTLEKSEFEPGKVKSCMVGREIGEHYYREDKICTYDKEVVIRVENVTTGRGLTENVSFELHKGEILGIGGLSHCGMHELGRAIFGEEPIVTGKVTYAPTGEEIVNARIAMKHEMGYVSKNRDIEALVLTASIRDNIIGAGFDKVSNHGIITPKSEKEYVGKQVEVLRIKCAGIDQAVKFLSGGNKQKVVFGKWIGRGTKILILDCPTRGVDIGVKAAMYEIMVQMKAEGKSILIISEEMAELIGMCDRLLIMKDGVISGELKRDDGLDEKAVIENMI